MEESKDQTTAQETPTLDDVLNDMTAGISVEQLEKQKTCEGEPALNSLKRWMKIKNDFKKEQGYDISKIPTIYDNIKFDMLHNPDRTTQESHELFDVAMLMCRACVPFEFGMTTKEKIDIGLKSIHPLLKKIQGNLLWWESKSKSEANPGD